MSDTEPRIPALSPEAAAALRVLGELRERLPFGTRPLASGEPPAAAGTPAEIPAPPLSELISRVVASLEPSGQILADPGHRGPEHGDAAPAAAEDEEPQSRGIAELPWPTARSEVERLPVARTAYVADRDPSYRGAVADALRSHGFDVVEFASGAELYDRAIATPPDIIVTETDLDELNGFEVLTKLRLADSDTRVMFLTDFDNPGVARVCRQRGALEYVSKDRDLDEVVHIVEDLLTPGGGFRYSRELERRGRGRTGSRPLTDRVAETEGAVGEAPARGIKAALRGLRNREPRGRRS